MEDNAYEPLDDSDSADMQLWHGAHSGDGGGHANVSLEIFGCEEKKIMTLTHVSIFYPNSCGRLHRQELDHRRDSVWAMWVIRNYELAWFNA